MPPDSSCGRLSANAVSWTRSSSSAARSLRCARGTPAARSGISTLRAAVSHGNSADSWNISETFRPPVEISPDVGTSSPAMRFSSVLLPQPEAPMRVTNSPGATESDTLSRACSVVSPRPNTLDTSLISTAGPAAVTGVTAAGAARRASRLMGSPVLVRRL